MPLPAPQLDNRKYQDLVDEMIARIPVHTPEWTNFNAADPGITMVQLFAHVAESVIYRANQIPERNRAKFLQLLGVNLNPAREARGLVAFNNERGPLEQTLISAGSELLAEKTPFRTTLSIDALPLDAKIFRKVPISEPSQELLEYYGLLYSSYNRDLPQELALYEALEADGSAPLNFNDTVDNSVWVALLGRSADANDGADDKWAHVREAVAGRTLSLGLVPNQMGDMSLLPVGEEETLASTLGFEMPQAGSAINFDSNGQPIAGYRELVARADFDPTKQSGIVEVTLPSEAAEIKSWDNLDPLESGVGDLPPQSEDTAINDRIITWIRVRASGSADLQFDWAGINAAPVRQFIRVNGERLNDGDGLPNQQRQLKRAPVLPGSVSVLGVQGDDRRDWIETDDLLAAGSEVPGYGAPLSDAPVNVFTMDHEAGLLRFGDGINGRRPRIDETLYASYEYSEGAEGNVGAEALKGGVNLPSGITGTNPVPTWGGSDAENIVDGEKQVRRILQHRDRLVTAEDFLAISWRTPGISLGRVEVVPAAHPDIVPITPGSAPGSVTLMVIPKTDPAFPNAPRPDQRFLGALCQYLEPRRLVTTEVALHGPKYVGIWISVGISVVSGHSISETVAAVKARLQAYLSPLPVQELSGTQLIPQLYGEDTDPALRGWPLNRDVHMNTLLAEAARATGVLSVGEVFLAQGNGPDVQSVELSGIELPEILGISVTDGAATPLDSIRGNIENTGESDTQSVSRLPVPVFPENC